MPRPSKIWYWKARKEWCVKINRIRHRLGPDKAEAERRFHEMMAKPEKRVQPDAVAVIVDLFLDWTTKNREPRTFEWYQQHLQSFLDSLPRQTMVVGELKPHHVHTWVDSKNWGKTYRRGAMTAVCRAFNWAEKMGHIDHSPLRGIEKPAADKREQVVSPAEYAEILTHVKGDFKDLLVTVWETGARPFEVTRLEARHVDLQQGRWVFPVNESKGRRHQRVVYMTDTVLAIVTRLMANNRGGPLFRNRSGEPWTPYAVNCSFMRLQAEMGKVAAPSLTVSDAAVAAKMKEIKKRRKQMGKEDIPDSKLRYQVLYALKVAAARKHAPKYCMYAFRHSFITNGLKKGVDPVTMATLVGHVDLRMIHSVYSHVSQDHVFMRQAAAKAVQ